MIINANKIITIWNKWTNPNSGVDKWYRHVIKNCSWNKEQHINMTGDVAVMSSTLSVIVNFNVLYKPWRQWKTLSEAERIKFFTINTGDLVALNESSVEITGEGSNTLSEVQEVLKPNSFYISFFSDETDDCKKGKHYRIRGV